jgi:hypothetical protein
MIIECLVLGVVLAVAISASLCIIVLSSCALVDIRRCIGRTEDGCVSRVKWQRQAPRLRHL